MLFLDLPDTERNTDLGIITAWTSDDTMIRSKQLVQPFFYDGFAIATRNADHRQIFTGIGFGEMISMMNRQCLQCF